MDRPNALGAIVATVLFGTAACAGDDAKQESGAARATMHVAGYCWNGFRMAPASLGFDTVIPVNGIDPALPFGAAGGPPPDDFGSWTFGVLPL